MSRFVRKVVTLVLVVVLSNLAIYLLLPNAKDSGAYLATINDKHALLARTAAPRIIFVGSSDLALGLDSVQVEQAFGMPVINMGLHGALGPRLDLEAVRPYISPGDIIIASMNADGMTDRVFYGRDEGTGIHLWLLKYRPQIIGAINSPRQWLLLVQEYPSFIKTIFAISIRSRFQFFYPRTPPASNPYRRSGFNDHGDLVAHLGLPSRPWTLNTASDSSPQSSRDNADIEDYYTEYQLFVKERGASIYILPTPMSESAAARDATRNASGARPGQTNIEIAIPFIGEATNYIYPDNYFFDSPVHLNETGRAVRTKQIIQDLTKLLAESR